ncbi:MAG: phosphotransferase [Planctomyces sp.]
MPRDPRILEVLKQYRLQLISADRISGGFSGATVWRVIASPGRLFALRWTPQDAALPTDRVLRLHDLLTRVFQRGFEKIPVPVCLTNGLSILPADQGFWQLEPWMPGQSLIGTEVTTSQIESTVVALMEFWQRAASLVSSTAADNWCFCQMARSPSVVRRLRLVEELRDGELDELSRKILTDPDSEYREYGRALTELLRERLDGIEVRLREVEGLLFPLQPVIRDLRAPHLLFSGNDLSGLIDLTACGTDHVTVDLSRLVRSWFGTDHDRVEDFLSRFAQFHRLSLSELQLLSVLDESSVALSPVTWIRRRTQDVSARRASGWSSQSLVCESELSLDGDHSGQNEIRQHLKSLIHNFAEHRRLRAGGT